MLPFFGVNVVAVDDDLRDLETIRKGLEMAQIPCLTFHYDYDSEIEPDLEIPPLPHARIVFMDLNLLSTGTSEPKIYATYIRECLTKMKLEGPYILALWTQNNEETAEKTVRILKRDRGHDFAPFLNHVFLNKDEFRYIETEDEETKKEKIIKLKKRIMDIISSEKVFFSTLILEKNIYDASAMAIADLFHVAVIITEKDSPKTDNEDIEKANKLGQEITNATVQQYEQVLRALTYASMGKLANENYDEAITLGILPLIEDKLNNNIVTANWHQCLPAKMEISPYARDLINIKYMYDFKKNIGADESFFSTSTRGAFIKININDIASAQFQEKFGVVNYKTLCSDYLELKKCENEEEKEKIRTSLVFGFIEVSAICDYVQKKNRLCRYLLAVLIPEEYSEYASFCYKNRSTGEETSRESKDQAIERFPYTLPLEINKGMKQQYVLEINLRYLFTMPANNILLDKPVFRLRKQVVDDIVYKYARHHSRPGLTII